MQAVGAYFFRNNWQRDIFLSYVSFRSIISVFFLVLFYPHCIDFTAKNARICFAVFISISIDFDVV